MWFVAVVLILLAALFIFFVIKNYILRRMRFQQIQPDPVVVDLMTLTSVLSVTTVTSENSSEEEEESIVELSQQGNKQGNEQGNEEASEGDPDAIVVAADAHLHIAADVHIPDEQDISSVKDESDSSILTENV